MRVCLLVHPRWQAARAYAFAQALAEKHPDCIVLSAGGGLPTYQAERGALAAGLRVAAFRVVERTPGRGMPPETSGPFPAPIRDVVVYELLPGNEEHAALLTAETGRVVGSARGGDAEILAREMAAANADVVVALTPDPKWPGIAAARLVAA